MRHQILFLILLCTAHAWAQQQNVSGIVKGPDGGIANVSVREIDSNRRFFNHTRTDGNGLFSFHVRDAQHSLQFYAPGYRTISHKMLGEKKFNVTMEKCRTSPYVATAKVILRSDRLFNGHYLGNVVNQPAWIEKMCDTLYSIILPIQMERLVDEYPAGRQLIILDEYGRQVTQCENVIDVYPLSEDPDKLDTYCVSQSYTGTDRIPGGADDETKLYAYPHFQISRAQLEQFCEKPELLGRLAVDTYRANNYWNFFPTPKTIGLIKKALAK
ncbi:MAG: carboxypeptidase regulatory-like domain-containing protein [Bacteroidaceae bacterium]|nr:carboxypeptidase regulatory-like domain-containing protein [Bacteroidaceae bacterium]